MKIQPDIEMFERNAAKRKLNLQLFAEGTEGGDGEGAQGAAESGKEGEAQVEISDEARVLIAQLKAENAKLKNKNDVLATENATKTKQLREKMTAQEQEAEAKKEAEAEREKQFKDMQRKLLVIESTSTYMDILKMSKETAQQYAEARADADTDKENDILRQHMKAYEAKMMQSFLAERGEVNAGHGDSGESKAVELLKMLPKSSGGVDENILKAYM